MLITPHVFLDTEVLVGKNFQYSHKDIKALLEHVESGKIILHLTEVHHREIKKKIRDRVSDAKRAIEPLRSVKQRPNAMILRNVQDLGFGGIFNFDEARVIAELLSQFEQFLNNGSVQIEPVAGLLAGPILDKYFDSEPPFEKREEKKNEFPDAFGVAVVAEWCRSKGSNAYLISGDKGVRKACEQEAGVHPLSTIPELTAIIALAAPLQAEIARGWFNFYAAYIRERIARDFEAAGFILTDQEGDVLDTQVNEEDVKLGDPAFLSVEDGYAEVAVSAEVPFIAEVTYDDPNTTFWIEGDKYVVDSIQREVEQTESVKVYVDLSFNPAVAAPLVGQEQRGDVAEVIDHIWLDVGDISITVDSWDDYK